MVLACAGCSAAMPDAAAAVQSTSDAYFVMGVQPHNMMLLIDDGVHTLPLHEYGQSQGDYIVAKATPGQRLMIRQAAIMSGHSIFGRALEPCTIPLSFSVPAGKVVYITNLTVSPFGAPGQFKVTHVQDLEGAREYVNAHYPQLSGKVEQGAVSFSRVTPCH